jgi:hypothetical protein
MEPGGDGARRQQRMDLGRREKKKIKNKNNRVELGRARTFL